MPAVARLFLASLFVYSFPQAVQAAESVPAKAEVPTQSAPSTKQLLASVERSLAFLEHDGVQWMRDKACITCHQVPAMLWSLHLAKNAGLKVDAAKLKLWNQWALDNGLKRSVYYKVTEDALAKLKAAGFSDELAAKLKPLQGANYVFVGDFTSAAEKALGKSFAIHKNALLEACGKPGQGGGGAPPANQYMALLISGTADHADDASVIRRTLVTGLVKSQKKDGSWEPAGQFLAQQRPKPETSEVITLWTLLALSTAEESSPEQAAAERKAREFAAKAGESNNTETILLRALLAEQDGDAARRDAMWARLAKSQHADGGWGWLLDRETSDPFTTGMVLYGLGVLGRNSSDPSVGKAQRYLLQQQTQEGDWKLVGKTISARHAQGCGERRLHLFLLDDRLGRRRVAFDGRVVASTGV
ncbi:MAG: terpene cyclase/mutase family protein [Pirellulales bacterium]